MTTPLTPAPADRPEPEPLSDAELAALLALAEEATPGPRTVTHMTLGPHGMTFFGDSHYNVRAANPDDPETGPQWTTSGVRSEADARLTAALDPDVVRRLIAAARERERLRFAFEKLAEPLRQRLEDVDSLDRAWQEAEAALPYKRNELTLTHFDWNGDRETWVADAVSRAIDGEPVRVESDGPTPAAALRALRAALRERRP